MNRILIDLSICCVYFDFVLQSHRISSFLHLLVSSLQFLSLVDYLLRNFTLLRLEAAVGIKSDIERAIRLMQVPLLYFSSLFSLMISCSFVHC